ncbi:alanine racemase [Azoarcus sp. KH32C]|uniref:alanine racemase n=1 Tax=Azoarcus sp. KH32C TaxID=748247 RepID=UPI0002385DC0|nr:alanine racemase [Azoarcus sp. KH32C]BAL27118.1 ornithine/diaminopimelate/arginine decarboxylase,family protein [Azoarcus sp. KH32C]
MRPEAVASAGRGLKDFLPALLQDWQLADGSGASVLEAFAQRHGTPLYLYSAPLIERRIAELRDELPAGLALLYALKANPHRDVVAHVAPLVDGCDVTSAAEIGIALGAGVAGHKLSVAGPGKSDEDLAAAVAADALVVIESLGEARRLAALAGGRRPRIALRINPPFGLAADARMGGGPRRFGVDSEAAPAVLAEIGRLPLAFEGFHVYAGSRCLDALAIAEAQRATLRLACELAPFAPAPVRLLNLGGGLGIPCFPGEAPLNLPALGDALRATAREAARVLPDARLALELGRYLVGEAGLYLTRVVERKESRGRVFLILDGGAHHHWHATGALEGRRHLHFPLVLIGATEDRATERVTVCGPLCAPHDTWAEDIELPAAGPGDLVAVFQSGAYGASASPQAFLGRPPSAELLTDWPARRAGTRPHPHQQLQETEHA